MILCDVCKGTGSTPSATPFGHPAECDRCRATGRLTFKDLRHGDHSCLLFKDPHVQLSDALDFLVQGLALGERLFYAWDEHPAVEIRAKLVEKGVDVTREIERGAIEIVEARTIYTFDGEFEPAKVLEFYKGYIDATLRAGFTGLRAAGEMTWALRNPDWFARLGEYEAMADQFMKTEKLRVTGLCQYDRRRFTPEMIRTVLDNHGAAVLS